MSIKYFLALLTIVLLTTCEYEPSAINFVKLNPNVKPAVVINFKDLPDTLFVDSVVVVAFDLNPTTDGSVDVVLGGQTIFSSTVDASGTFTIDPTQFANGYYDLTFSVHTTSGTGSIAEHLGKEYLVFTRKLVALIYKQSPVPLAITSVDFKDGSVLVTWPKYPYPNLKKISLLKTTYGKDQSGQIVVIDSHEFDFRDAKQTSFLDTTAIGFKSLYQLRTQTWLNEYANGDLYEYKQTVLPDFLTVKTNRDFGLDLTWTSTRYYRDLAKYVIDNSFFSIHHENTRVGDTTMTIEAPFGNAFDLSLSIQPKGLEHTFFISKRNVYVGNKIPAGYDYFFTDGTDDFYYINYDHYFGRAASGKGVDSVYGYFPTSLYGETAIAVSPNSAHIAICEDGYLMLMDGQTLSLVGGGMSFGNFSFPVYSPIITNDNHVFFIFNHGLLSYDPGTHSTVDDVDRGGFVDITSIRLSADENYMLANQTNGVQLLGLQNRLFTTDTNLGHIGWQGYFTTEANTVYLTDGQSIEIYQLSTLTKVGGSQLSQKISLDSFDSKRGWIGGLDVEKKNFIIYDIKTGQLIRKVLCNPSQFDLTYTLHDGRLYSKHGYVIDLR